MANNSLVSDKRYVEFEGLQALILKLGAMRQEYLNITDGAAGDITDINKAIADLQGKLAAVYDFDNVTTAPEFEEGVALDTTKIVESIVDYINKFKAEFVAKDENDAAATEAMQAVIDSIVAVIGAEKNTDGTLKLPAEGTVIARLGAAEAAITANLEEFRSKAFVGLDTTVDKNANTVTVKFQNSKVDAEGNPEVIGSFTIDTADFVVDGLLGDVETVTIADPAGDNSSWGAYKGDVKVFDQEAVLKGLAINVLDLPKYAGKKYLTFTFKVNDVDGGNVTVDPAYEPNQVIWVDLADLYKAYEFAAEASNEKPEDANVWATLTPEVEETAAGAKVTYKLVMSAKFSDNMAQVDTNTAAIATNAQAIADNVVAIKANADAIEAHGERLDAIETAAGEVEGRVKSLEDAVNGYEDTDGTAVPGLIDAAQELLDWRENGIVPIRKDETAANPIEGIEEYFDYWVMSGEPAAEAMRKKVLEASTTRNWGTDEIPELGDGVAPEDPKA